MKVACGSQMSKWKPSPSGSQVRESVRCSSGSQVQVEAKSKWKPSPSGSQVRESVRCPSEAKSSESQAKWKPGVKGCGGIEFVKVQQCEGVVDEVQDGSITWPCCLWCWCNLTMLVLDQVGTSLIRLVLDQAGGARQCWC